MIRVGIDVGVTGAVAAVRHGCSGLEIVELADCPTRDVKSPSGRRVREMDERAAAGILASLSRYPGERVAVNIEYQQTFPGNASPSTFALGMGYGSWIGILGALGIAYQKVTPIAWKKYHGLKVDRSIMAIDMAERLQGLKPDVVLKEMAAEAKRRNKTIALELAGQMFPDAELKGPLGGAKDGRADALLIALYDGSSLAVEVGV